MAAGTLAGRKRSAARKQPLRKTKHGGLLGVWSHAAHPNPRVDYPNVSMMLLQRLFDGEATAKDLYTNGVEASLSNVIAGLHFLERAGLVELEKTHRRVHTPSKKSSNLTVASLHARLSPQGIRLLDAYARTGSLPERLRRLLLEAV